MIRELSQPAKNTRHSKTTKDVKTRSRVKLSNPKRSNKAASAPSTSVLPSASKTAIEPVRRTDAGLAFAAPPRVRSGPVEDEVTERVTRALNLARSDIVDIAWADNGPGWVAVLLGSADAVLAVQRPDAVDLDIGLVGPYPSGSAERIEVRAFSPMITSIEDPVTGSLNASLGQWLLESGRVAAPYVASQGTAMGRRGRVHVSRDADGQVWVGGGTVTCVSGTVEL